MSWKPAFIIKGESKPCTNAQAFATQAEALNSAYARFLNWMIPTDYTAVESDEPVNYVRVDGRDVMVEEDTSAHEEAEYLAELNRGYAKDRI